MIYVLFFYSYSFIILNQNKNVPLQWHLSDDMLWCKWGTIILPLSNLYMSQHRREDGLLDLGKKKLIMIKNSDLGFKMGFLQQKKKTQINIIRLKVQQKTAVLLVNMQAAWGGGGGDDSTLLYTEGKKMDYHMFTSNSFREKYFLNISNFFAPSDSRFSNSFISAKYCPIITNHTSMERLFSQLSDYV